LADLIPVKSQGLTAAQYGALADVPPELVSPSGAIKACPSL
jgi:hypothetical protein